MNSWKSKWHDSFYCTDPSPEPNPKAKVTKHEPTRIFQRVFWQKFKNEIQEWEVLTVASKIKPTKIKPT